MAERRNTFRFLAEAVTMCMSWTGIDLRDSSAQ